MNFFLFFSINDLTGDIATCSATWLHVWSANGDPLATVNTSVGCADRMQQILCVTFSTAREWDQQNVVSYDKLAMLFIILPLYPYIPFAEMNEFYEVTAENGSETIQNITG